MPCAAGCLDYPLSYGVSVPTIREIAKAYAPAHAFALFLFRQQVRELKLAAAFIDDPSEVTAAQMREWADGLTNTELVEQVVSALFRHAPDAPDMALGMDGLAGADEAVCRLADGRVGYPRGKEPRMGRPFFRTGRPDRPARRSGEFCRPGAGDAECVRWRPSRPLCASG